MPSSNSVRSTGYMTWAIPVRRSGETAMAVKGSTALPTCGALPAAVTVSLIALA